MRYMIIKAFWSINPQSVKKADDKIYDHYFILAISHWEFKD